MSTKKMRMSCCCMNYLFVWIDTIISIDIIILSCCIFTLRTKQRIQALSEQSYVRTFYSFVHPHHQSYCICDIVADLLKSTVVTAADMHESYLHSKSNNSNDCQCNNDWFEFTKCFLFINFCQLFLMIHLLTLNSNNVSSNISTTQAITMMMISATTTLILCNQSYQTSVSSTDLLSEVKI